MARGRPGRAAEGPRGTQRVLDDIDERLGVVEIRAVILLGSGVPASSLGRDGDVYMDTATKTMYFKAAGSWA